MALRHTATRYFAMFPPGAGLLCIRAEYGPGSLCGCVCVRGEGVPCDVLHSEKGGAGGVGGEGGRIGPAPQEFWRAGVEGGGHCHFLHKGARRG